MSVGVFDGTVLLVDGHRYRVPANDGPPDVAFLAELARRARVAQLWTMPGVELAADVEGAWNVLQRPTDSGHAGLAIVALARDQGACGPWRGTTEASTLLGALTLLERVLTVPWQRSPGGTGAQLLRANLRRRGLYCAIELPPPALTRPLVEHNAQWLRQLDEHERRQPWLITYDKNSTFLGSGQAAEVGIGEPVHELRPEFNRARAGYWLVELGEADPCLFDPTGARQQSDKPRWLTTPSVAIAADLGRLRQVLEGWLYPGCTRVFRLLCERFIEARAELEAEAPTHPAARLAIAALKRCYAAILSGYLAARFHELDAADDRDPLYRPDWRDTIVAVTRTNIWRDVQRARLPICGARVDSVYVTSDDDDLVRAAGQLKLGAGVGHWKHVETRELADYVLADGCWRPSRRVA
jgi:hypothetical protein